MASSLFGIGISGLNSAQAGLLTTGHNISNVDTPGYSRQTIVQGTNNPRYTGAGFFGTGVHVQTVQRHYNHFLEVQAREMQASTSHLQRYAMQIGRIDQALADLDSGLSPALDHFFAGAHEITAYPRDAAARQSMLSGSAALVARFHALDTQLNDARRDVNSQLEANVVSVNSIASRIAELNERIIAVGSQGNGVQAPNDLLDQRDMLVRDLNQLVRANVVQQDDGSYNVFIGSGQPLVVREQANTLSLVTDPEYGEDQQIALHHGSNTIRLRARDLAGGEIGGLLEFREQSLNEAHNALGRIAMTLAHEFNEQHKLGQDLNGEMGKAYFGLNQPGWHANINNAGTAVLDVTVADYSKLTTSDYRLHYDGTQHTLTRLPQGTRTELSFSGTPPTAEVDGLSIAVSDLADLAPGDSFLIQPTREGAKNLSLLIHDTHAIAAASPIRTEAATANTGNATISGGSVSSGFTAGEYTISFSNGGTEYTVVDAADNVVASDTYKSGESIDFNGIKVAITGVPVDGDVFTVGPNLDGDGDNRNALALAALQTSNVMVGGTVTLQGGYAQLVSSIGNKTREVQVTGEAQASMLRETLAARESVSGVNLDEEAANLLRYQQAYQAASKVISVAGSLFDSILEIMR